MIFLTFLWISLEDAHTFKIRHSRLLLLSVVLFFYMIGQEDLAENGRWLSRLFLSSLPAGLTELINGVCFSFEGIGGSDIWLLYLCSFLTGPDFMWEAYLADLLLFLTLSFMAGRKRMAMGPAICLGTTFMVIFGRLI